MQNSNIKKQLRWLLFTTLGMFFFGFALVSLYDVFCDITGLNGKDYSRAETSTTIQTDQTRTVTVEFVTYLNKQLPWQFEPEVKQIELHPGERKEIKFIATNNSNTSTVGRAVPSITPGIAAQYLVKTECFCFLEQPLSAKQQAFMPLTFYIDPNIPDDITTLTLAYTLFNNEPNVTEVTMR